MIFRPSIRLALSALLPFAAASGQVAAAIFTVGSGAGCTHGTIQSAINAANAAPGADTVRLTRSLTYEPEANTITTTQDLNVVGGFATCTSPASDGVKTVVSGAGGAQEPVFRITANGAAIIQIRLLTITLGDEDGAGGGGGIHFRGSGILEIIESDITNNTAGYGGGIYAEALGSNAELIISNNTTISGNTARYSGGGLFLSGPLKMTMAAPSSIVAFNKALGLGGVGGYGGGLRVVGPAIANIGSPGIAGLGVIYSNSAVRGGGIAIAAGSAHGVNGRVNLYSTDGQHPVTVRGNSATATGGGVYLKPYIGTVEYAVATLCASDFRIDDNQAQEGSAIYGDLDRFIGIARGSDVFLNCRTPGSVRCAAGVACNTISGNGTSTVGGQPTEGATILLQDGGELNARRLEMRGNRGGYAMRLFGTSFVADCLIADNQVTRQLISFNGGDFTAATIDSCTLAGNVIGSTDVIHAEIPLTLSNSIIDQPGNLALAYSGNPADLHVNYVLSSDTTSLPGNADIVAGPPGFVDGAHGDYHLRLASLAVDFAPAIPGDDRDLDGWPRDQDMPGVPDLFGVRDLGAYERQRGALDCGAGDTIFCDGFDLL